MLTERIFQERFLRRECFSPPTPFGRVDYFLTFLRIFLSNRLDLPCLVVLSIVLVKPFVGQPDFTLHEGKMVKRKKKVAMPSNRNEDIFFKTERFIFNFFYTKLKQNSSLL